MNDSLLKMYEAKLKVAKENYEKKGYEFTIIDNCQQLVDLVKTTIEEGSLVGDGGSETLKESGVMDLLRQMNINFLDTHRAGIEPQLKNELYHQALSSDYFFMSCNAMDVNGNLYNIDLTGNRVAALCYGPKKVIVICGVNKLFENEEAAYNHLKNVACSANAIRLNKDTPCAKVGKCLDCSSKDRICSHYVKTSLSFPAKKIHVIMVKEELGF